MKRVLGVVGSPRREGNTHILVSTILEGAKEAGAATDILFLNDLRIRECDGCHACWQRRPCSKHDDMNDVYPKIVESDAIIFGTPVYWYGPTALMKAFIDRFVYFNCPENRAKVRNKPAVTAVPYEEDSPEMADLLVAFFEKSLRYLEMDLVGKILVAGTGRKGQILEKPERPQEACELGGRLAQGEF